METVIIKERKKSVITDSILMIAFGVVPLFFLIKWLLSADEGIIFIVFLILVTLFFPVVLISAYILDAQQKIILSEYGIKLCYGRNFVDIMHFEGSFTIPPDHEIPWDKVAGFQMDIYEQREPTEGGGYMTSTKYGLLIKVKDKGVADPEKFSKNCYSFKLGKFEEHPKTIVEICERYQRNVMGNEGVAKKIPL